ncbi:MAG: hypothetical protein EXR73_13330, partial [Myxococcales bacterium]|nr:hypothetical protein [Myxococcales bacterium]
MAFAAAMHAAPSIARAHLAPDALRNNRYAKVTLLPDAVRVVYTIYFGDRPGAGERQRMDRNRDGHLDDTERDAFAAQLLTEVGPAILVELDGAPAPARFSVADVGLGTPATHGASFSVDLVLVAAIKSGAGDHTLRLVDRYPIPLPGEQELRVEESPGVQVTATRLGPRADGMLLHFAWTGAPGTPEERALTVSFRVAPDALPSGVAPSSQPASRRAATGTLGGVLLVVVL